MAETVTEMIGDEYKGWNNGNVIFISSPTGSGKSYFILHTLLKWCAQPRPQEIQYTILYLVNRKILKEQLEKEIDNSEELCKYKRWICIMLYQDIENILKPQHSSSESIKSVLDKIRDDSFVVCDECHYFLSDANFNTKTDLSFNWIHDRFRYQCRIFMSATIDKIEEYIREYIECEDWERTKIYKLPLGQRRPSMGSAIIKKYPIAPQKRDYDYVIPRIIYKDSIASIVSDGKGKWIVFVDNIKFGRELEKKIKNQLKENQIDGSKELDDMEKKVVMITSEYEQDEESFEEVKNVTAEEKFKAKVIIATSVMDNGITIKDTEMRNIVLIADTETKFIQMLGRKRKKDGEKLILYIVRQEEGQFVRRKQITDRLKKIADDYTKYLYDHLHRNYFNINTLTPCHEEEESICWHQHIWLMDQIETQNIWWEDVFRIFRIENGEFYLSFLAARNLQNQASFYNKILKKFKDEGEDAFVKEQLEWMGITDKKADSTIRESKCMEAERCKAVIAKEIEKILGDKESVQMSRSQAENWKKLIRTELKILAQSLEWKEGMPNDEYTFNKEKNTIINNRSNQHMTKDVMDFLREYAKLPYDVIFKNKTWTIMRYKENNPKDM